MKNNKLWFGNSNYTPIIRKEDIDPKFLIDGGILISEGVELVSIRIRRKDILSPLGLMDSGSSCFECVLRNGAKCFFSNVCDENDPGVIKCVIFEDKDQCKIKTDFIFIKKSIMEEMIKNNRWNKRLGDD